MVSNLWTFCLCANIVQSVYIVTFFILYSQFPVLPRMMSSASHPRRYSYEDQGFRCHTQVRDHRKCSGDGSFKEPLESKGRSHSKIQSFSDSFEQQLCFRTKRSVSLVCNRVIEYLSCLRKGNSKSSYSPSLRRTNLASYLQFGIEIFQRRQWNPTLVLLPGKSHGRRSLVGCNPWGCKESDTTERLHFHFLLSCIGEGNGNPLQCSCLENPRDGGTW